jgi:hypothetical protein
VRTVAGVGLDVEDRVVRVGGLHAHELVAILGLAIEHVGLADEDRHVLLSHDKRNQISSPSHDTHDARTNKGKKERGLARTLKTWVMLANPVMVW